MNLPTYQSANSIQIQLCRQLMTEGAPTGPRGMLTRELLGASFVLDNPRNRSSDLPHRNWAPDLAAGELAWHLRGDAAVAPLAHYAPIWRKFSDDGQQIRGSCYGARIFGNEDGESSQWENVIKLLNEDRDSRRAILTFRIAEDVSSPSRDISCTNTMQFILRQGKLHAFVNMRSNDVIWGVPYDLFLFTCLQELMAVSLGVPLGSYHHYAASMHVYERHFELARRLASLSSKDVSDGSMPPIESVDSVRGFIADENCVRTGVPLIVRERTQFELACLSFLGTLREAA